MENNYLMHYGTKYHSGRYEYGSGEFPCQHDPGFSWSKYAKGAYANGMSETDVAKSLGVTTSELRANISKESQKKRSENISKAIGLKEHGYSNRKIAEMMGTNESTIRGYLKNSENHKQTKTEKTAEVLKKQLENVDALDVGAGMERHMGISRTQLKTSINALKEEGYKVYYYPVEQMGTGKKTSVMTLVKPETQYTDISKNIGKIKIPSEYISTDRGENFNKLVPPKNISEDRVGVVYAEQGGTARDGLMYIRRGVEDLSLGTASYAQVRIGVNGTHYLKGMAIYADPKDMPEGVDVLFWSNKSEKKGKLGALKEQKDDPDNPFGASYKQNFYKDKNGDSQVSAANIVREEGEWGDWSKSISSQVLSKQDPAVAQRQLKISSDSSKNELADIMSLTNPILKEKMLNDFAESCEAKTVELKAASFPRQATQVILPQPQLKETEIYAPNYKDGEKVSLIRYPHGGIFEIPTLTVNNKDPQARSQLGKAQDAVGINPKVAEQLSGADFDGDTVVVIPNNNGQIKTSSPLEGLKGFDPKERYHNPNPDGTYPYKIISSRAKQMEMGKVSNLITDMTIKGASEEELARAVRHSMVVIDAEKHKLDYKQSEIDNGISALKTKYQGGPTKGASTLISKASSQARVPNGEFYTNSKGKLVERMDKSTKMIQAKDPYDLSSGTVIENVYADYASTMRQLKKMAEEESKKIEYIPYNKEASKQYAQEKSSLLSKLNEAKKNAPLERQAQIQANVYLKEARAKYSPDELTAEKLGKIKGQAIAKARMEVGAHKSKIDIAPKEWEAIQKGALSSTSVKEIFANTDSTLLKKYATPRKETVVTSAMSSKAKSMYSSGRYTYADIAEALGVSTTTVRNEVLGLHESKK